MKKSRDLFIKQLKLTYPTIEISVADTIKEAVQNADIALINTGFSFQKYSDMPMIKSSYISNFTVFVCSSFAHFPDKDIIEKAINVCDMFSLYENYIEELGYPAFRHYGSPGSRFADLVVENKISRDTIIDLSSIITKKETISEKRPIIFSSTGMSLEDIAIGTYICNVAKKAGIGKDLD